MMTLQQLADRREIDDVLIASCHAIDSHNWDELDDVFTPDAIIDYTVFGGPKGPYSEIKLFLAEVLPQMVYAQHIISTSRIRLDGDRATGRTICTNPVGVRDADGSIRHMVYALWYIDELVRTDEGWRIATRREEISHTENVPGMAVV
ncbi:nuclear transport factor 2 family protein [soil metagenome]